MTSRPITPDEMAALDPRRDGPGALFTGFEAGGATWTSPTVDQARDFVRTTPTSGLAQFALLTSLGLHREHSVLEIGCGALHLAKPLVATLHPGRYWGMDPNEWLRRAAIEADPSLGLLLAARGAQFSSRDDFDATTAFGRGHADWIFAHSVLSHASGKQLYQFMREAARTLHDGGLLVCSLLLADTAAEATYGDEWEYPGSVLFDRDTVTDATRQAGLWWREASELRDLYVGWCPVETHHWITVGLRG